ncbi:hypothetical protein C8029_12875 [Roseobacter sp. TSBP12]|nr:hypothetical protein C8029_12875 [Roseobacter sp. TSBP12]
MVPPEILSRAWPIARLAQPKSTWFGAVNQMVPPMSESLAVPKRRSGRRAAQSIFCDRTGRFGDTRRGRMAMFTS